MHNHETYGAGMALDSLHSELVQLNARYGDFLKQESVSGDVACLTCWVESYYKGSRFAEECLMEHGTALLESIKEKLKAAEADLQRMDEESPNSVNVTGKTAHKLSQATAITVDAGKKLETALEQEIIH